MCDWCLIDVAHPLRLGKKQGEKKVNPCDISHCIVTRFGPLIDIDLVWSAKRGDRCGPRTQLELIVIAERKARINMQQTEREERERGGGGRKANWHAATCVLSRSSNQMWQLWNPTGNACKEMLIISKIKINEIGHKNSIAPSRTPLPLVWVWNSGVGAVCAF